MISVIVAIARRGVIGGGNSLLWHIREDLQRFKRITTGHPVVMGRKTFESIGRPLPGRRNVVVTRNKDFAAAGCETAGSLEEAVSKFSPEEEVFIIGGAEIYAQSLPFAGKLYITEVDADFEGDTYFPRWDKTLWRETSREFHPRGESFPHPFSFVDYEKA